MKGLRRHRELPDAHGEVRHRRDCPDLRLEGLRLDAVHGTEVLLGRRNCLIRREGLRLRLDLVVE